jgi:phosphatidylglycerol:prolipoprotein diacylglycerol transferase
VPTAVISLDFDPYLRLFGQAVRWETLAVGASIFIALVVAALAAGRVPRVPAGGRSVGRDDMLFIVLGVIPGAVLGGRLTYVLVHLDYYRANPPLIVDPSSGGLALSGAVVLGALTGIYVAGLLDAPIGRWLDVAAVALVVGLGLGKLAQVLGGSGQGAVSSVSWATAYLGPGPWGVLGPDLPAQPSQVYEALGDGVLLLVLLGLGRLRAFRGGQGRRFAVALGGWAVIRFGVAFTWRDATVAGGLRAEQLVDLGILLIALVALAGLARRPATIAEPTPRGTPPAVPSGA